MSAAGQEDNLIVQIDSSWSTDHGIGISGWILSKGDPLERMEVCVDDVCVPVNSWHSRPDITAQHPEYKTGNCGFAVQIPRLAKHQVVFKVKTQENELSKVVSFNGSNPSPPKGFAQGRELFNQFIQLVNEHQLKVLEIGSRIVSPGSSSKRSLFPNATTYTGFDYYADMNTDVVGDAHKLSSYFHNQRFDAIFSMSVFEHLAMPWLVAKEINRLLEIGGITLHSTHSSWPIHETPWDFWRFSDESLKVLFSPALGFEVLGVGYFEPARIYLDKLHEGQELFPMAPAFGGVSILARKVAEIDPDKFNWNVTVEEILDLASQYPQPSQLDPPNLDSKESGSVHLGNDTILSPQDSAAQFTQTQSQQPQETIRGLREKIKELEGKLENSESDLSAMRSSKFWLLRGKWFSIKRAIGIRGD